MWCQFPIFDFLLISPINLLSMLYPYISIFSSRFVPVLLFSFFFLGACNEGGELPLGTSRQMKEFVNELRKQSTLSPERTIQQTDSLLRKSPLPEGPILIPIYLERQKAFAALKNMDSVLVTGEQIRVLASVENDSLAMAQSLMPVRGDIDYKSQQKMLPYFPGAIATFDKKGMLFEKAKLSGSYGAILLQKGDFVNAQNFLFQAYEYFKAVDSIRPLMNICINIGNTYSNVKSIEKAKEYYNKALDIAQQLNDSMAQVSVWMNRGTIFSEKQQDSAIYNTDKALAVLPQKAPYYLKMKIDYNRAKSYLALSDYPQAENIYLKMLSDCVANQLLEGEAMARKGLGEVYIATHRIQESIQQLTRSVAITDSLGMYHRSTLMRSQMIQSYLNLGDYKTAYQLFEKNSVQKDSIVSEDKQVAVHELETKYETAKKEHEIERLGILLTSRRKIIAILSISLFVLFILLRQRNRLYKERTHSYEKLMEKYREEKSRVHFKNVAITADIMPVIKHEEENKHPLDQKIVDFFTHSKPYQNPKLKVQDLSIQFGVSDKDISAAMKRLGHPNFAGFTNRYRVEEARALFDDPQNDHLKLEVIAEIAGFGTRQNFYNAFEYFTGVNPGYYRKQIQLSQSNPSTES